MHRLPSILLATLLPLAAGEDAPDPETVREESSYGFGYRAGAQFAADYGSFGIRPDDLDRDSFLSGFLDAFRGRETDLTEEQLGEAMQSLGERIEKREKQLAAANLAAGEAFLEQNAERPEVTVTDSGLQYEVLEQGGDQIYVEPGEGEPAKQFLVHLRGTLIDGTEFDRSPPGEPVPATLDVIPGLREALTIMPVGAKWKIYLPGELAYGEQRRSFRIGPNATLIFELELVGITDATQVLGLDPPIPLTE